MYVDDCIIFGDSDKRVDYVIKMLHNGSENFDFTDEGILYMYQGVEVKELGDDNFELT